MPLYSLDQRPLYHLFYELSGQWHQHELYSEDEPKAVLDEAVTLLAGRARAEDWSDWALESLELWDREQRTLYRRLDGEELDRELHQARLRGPKPVLQPVGQPLDGDALPGRRTSLHPDVDLV